MASFDGKPSSCNIHFSQNYEITYTVNMIHRIEKKENIRI